MKTSFRLLTSLLTLAGLVAGTTSLRAADTTPPVIKITAPPSGDVETNQITVRGLAKDAAPGRIYQVYVRVNGSEWQLAELTVPPTAPNSALWAKAVTLATGTNVVEAWAVDDSFNDSLLPYPVKQYFYRVPSPLTLVTNGNGSLVTNQPGPYYVGRTYGVQCLPNPLGENLFSNVVAQSDSGRSVLYSATPDKTAQVGAKILFTMQTNLTLTGNFMNNRFVEAAGVYYGLFSDPAGVAHQSAGYIKIGCSRKLRFTGCLFLEGEKVSFSGKFDLAGVGTLDNRAARIGLVNEPIDVVPRIDWTGNKQITGTVSSPNNGWVADLVADQQVAYVSNTPPWLLGQKYTMVLPASANVAEPGGDGCLTITVAGTMVEGVWDLASAVLVSADGYSGDGEKLAPFHAPPSKDGRWPFYVPLYKYYRPAVNPPTATGTATTYNGSIQGWLTFVNPTNVQGDLFWTKTFWTNGMYDAGFTNQITIIGSPYRPPPLFQRVIQVTTGVATLQGGGLSEFSTDFDWTITDLGANKLVFPRPFSTDNPNGLSLAVNAKDGSITGAFRHPRYPGVRTYIHGAVLQDANVARGVFQGRSESGTLDEAGSLYVGQNPGP